MANIPFSPVSQNLSVTQGFLVQAKFVPRNPDGSIYDCTDITGGTITYGGGFNSYYDLFTANPTVQAADATGVTIQLSIAELDTMMSNMSGTSTGVFALAITDGTDTGKAVTGSLNLARTKIGV